jgi:hypothetical protein
MIQNVANDMKLQPSVVLKFKFQATQHKRTPSHNAVTIILITLYTVLICTINTECSTAVNGHANVPFCNPPKHYILSWTYKKKSVVPFTHHPEKTITSNLTEVQW